MAYFSVNIYDLLRGMKETIQYCRWNSHSPAVDWKSQTTEYNVWMRWNCQIFSLLFSGFDRAGGEKGGGWKKWSWLRKAQTTSVLLSPIKHTRHFLQAKYTKLCYRVKCIAISILYNSTPRNL